MSRLQKLDVDIFRMNQSLDGRLFKLENKMIVQMYYLRHKGWHTIQLIVDELGIDQVIGIPENEETSKLNRY